jgi:hypothetical protein
MVLKVGYPSSSKVGPRKRHAAKSYEEQGVGILRGHDGFCLSASCWLDRPRKR